ncbi:MAG: glycosyltransferase family 2 protein [Kiritimatiellales bacterium]|nr:glycosyltransferase family 2 protein [Kiritimatiellales bacterium]
MSIVSISMVRNEEDIIESFVRYHVGILDEMYIIDHDSDDETKAILEKLKKEGLPIHICNFSGIAQKQSELITECMEEVAKRQDIKWIVPLDGDEFLFSKKGDVSDEIAQLKGDSSYRLPWYNYIPTANDDLSEVNILRRIQHRLSDPHSCLTKLVVSSKIASREDIAISQGNHNLLLKQHYHYPLDIAHNLAIAHFPVRSINQLTKKNLLSWPRNLVRGLNKDAWHWRELFERLKTGDPLSQEELCDIAQTYGSTPEQQNQFSIVLDPLQAPALKYSADTKREEERSSLLFNALDTMEKIAQELASERSSAKNAEYNDPSLLDHCARLEADLERIHRSKSWRFTSWLRFADVLIKRTKKRIFLNVFGDSKKAKSDREKTKNEIAKSVKQEQKKLPSDIVKYIWHHPYIASPLKKDRSVQVVIPTNGQDCPMLRRCLKSVFDNAEGVRIAITIVVCPEDECSNEDIELLAKEHNAQVIYLPGPFNFSRSINRGLEQRKNEQYVLFLNDDCILQTPVMIRRMIYFIEEKRLSCIGPWLVQKNKDNVVLGKPRVDEFTYLTSPVPATCVIWDSEWLDRIGPLDEAFSKYGLEEADLSYRALQRGAFWGRLDDVEVLHENHASFGHEKAHFKSLLHQHNILIWRRKYPYVHSWGGGEDWIPLPGIHVVLWATNDVQPIGLIDNLNTALDGFSWIVTWSDNLESNMQIDLSESTADWCGTKKCSKNALQSTVKNAGLNINSDLANMYPVLCFLNASSLLDPERIRWLLPKMKHQQCAIAYGDYAIENSESKLIYKSSNEIDILDIPLEATLIHRSIVESGRLFMEVSLNDEDKLLWKRMKLNGVRLLAFPGKNVAKIANGAISPIIESKESSYSELVGIR